MTDPAKRLLQLPGDGPRRVEPPGRCPRHLEVADQQLRRLGPRVEAPIGESEVIVAIEPPLRPVPERVAVREHQHMARSVQGGAVLHPAHQA